jgi:hypothetical protein
LCGHRPSTEDADTTYPKRTLKVALLDANQKQREGSRYYADILAAATAIQRACQP